MNSLDKLITIIGQIIILCEYNYEYLGNSATLVITPLTDMEHQKDLQEQVKLKLLKIQLKLQLDNVLFLIVLMVQIIRLWQILQRTCQFWTLFRCVVMMVPNYEMIAEILLYSYGFSQARDLARKIVTTYQLCSEQLLFQDHYDYGTRGVKSVLTAAVLKKDEFILMLRAINDLNLAKFLFFDLPLFQGINNDIFSIKLPEIYYKNMYECINIEIEKTNLQMFPDFIVKVIRNDSWKTLFNECWITFYLQNQYQSISWSLILLNERAQLNERKYNLSPKLQPHEILVKTTDTVHYLLKNMFSGTATLFFGPTDTGKSVYIKNVQQNCQRDYILQQNQDFQYKQHLHKHNFLLIQKLETMGPLGGCTLITPRILRHLSLISLAAFDDETLNRIFGFILKWFFTNQNFPQDILKMESKIVNGTLEIYKLAMRELLSTPPKSHYLFNLRDFVKSDIRNLFSRQRQDQYDRCNGQTLNS
ncbi:unnamed protein product [Paramecium sonneborni]|uniref:Dynein heavy chain hydrolytic ATP-binding dynein motor region domain-containing protein n=1 Tax=Paramecium sonneborni TaxID=65129 RepID=A0A8S1RR84_9CILI|nr:unnamed protein product [Paramecium sonneborni]